MAFSWILMVIYLSNLLRILFHFYFFYIFRQHIIGSKKALSAKKIQCVSQRYGKTCTAVNSFPTRAKKCRADPQSRDLPSVLYWQPPCNSLSNCCGWRLEPRSLAWGAKGKRRPGWHLLTKDSTASDRSRFNRWDIEFNEAAADRSSEICWPLEHFLEPMILYLQRLTFPFPFVHHQSREEMEQRNNRLC